MGCFVSGTSVGRSGSPTYVILNLRNVLVVVPVKDFGSDLETLWETLGAGLFGNANIMKVFFDSRGIADYLYHRQNTILTSVFDLRVSEVRPSSDELTVFVLFLLCPEVNVKLVSGNAS